MRLFAVGDAFTGIRAVRKDRYDATNAWVYPSERSIMRSGAQEAARRVHDHDSPRQVSPPGSTVGHERDSLLPASRSLSASVSEREQVGSVCRREEGARQRGMGEGRGGGVIRLSTGRPRRRSHGAKSNEWQDSAVAWGVQSSEWRRSNTVSCLCVYVSTSARVVTEVITYYYLGSSWVTDYSSQSELPRCKSTEQNKLVHVLKGHWYSSKISMILHISRQVLVAPWETSLFCCIPKMWELQQSICFHMLSISKMDIMQPL